MLLNFLFITSSILFSSKSYPFEQKIINIIINIAKIIIKEINPAFDSIFSFDPKTLHEVTPKFETSFSLFPKLLYNLFLSIFISSNDADVSVT